MHQKPHHSSRVSSTQITIVVAFKHLITARPDHLRATLFTGVRSGMKYLISTFCFIKDTKPTAYSCMENIRFRTRRGTLQLESGSEMESGDEVFRRPDKPAGDGLPEDSPINKIIEEAPASTAPPTDHHEDLNPDVHPGLAVGFTGLQEEIAVTRTDSSTVSTTKGKEGLNEAICPEDQHRSEATHEMGTRQRDCKPRPSTVETRAPFRVLQPLSVCDKEKRSGQTGYIPAQQWRAPMPEQQRRAPREDIPAQQRRAPMPEQHRHAPMDFIPAQQVVQRRAPMEVMPEQQVLQRRAPMPEQLECVPRENNPQYFQQQGRGDTSNIQTSNRRIPAPQPVENTGPAQDSAVQKKKISHH